MMSHDESSELLSSYGHIGREKNPQTLGWLELLVNSVHQNVLAYLFGGDKSLFKH